ncbi:MAG: MBL fold metallo-hydrolase [Actinobacteria bacterium]|nr:MBL fold metallo-hydrolase [Actinomycetota bacterium]
MGLIPHVLEEENPSPLNTVAITCGPPIMIKYTLMSLEKPGFVAEQITEHDHGGNRMQIEWLGHSCFLITTGAGRTLVTDPYDPEYYKGTLNYAPVDVNADVVTISHHHPDHDNVDAVGGTPVIVGTPGHHEAEGFAIDGLATFHDAVAGAQRGDNIVFGIAADGISICHLGDLGGELTAAQVRAIGPIDVLLIPVGGVYTIGAAEATRVWQQLAPSLTIPMHYHNDSCLFGIDGVEKFLAGKPAVTRTAAGGMQLKKENLSISQKIMVLEPSR